MINAAVEFTYDQNTLHPLNPEWDRAFMHDLANGQISKLDATNNQDLSDIAGKSTHEVKTWVAAWRGAICRHGPYKTEGCYCREIPEWIAGFGSMSATTIKNTKTKAVNEEYRNV
ncbi:hypothetical protein P4S64_13805 [Vibrio sp. M60_M31a]